MNTNTGTLFELMNDEKRKSIEQEGEEFIKVMMCDAEENRIKRMQIPDSIPIKLQDATKKQKKKMQISKYDNRSKLGKTFTRIRQIRKI